jgi:hypothetical protein
VNRHVYTGVGGLEGKILRFAHGPSSGGAHEDMCCYTEINNQGSYMIGERDFV